VLVDASEASRMSAAQTFSVEPTEKAMASALPAVRAAFEEQGIDLKLLTVTVVYEAYDSSWAASSDPPPADCHPEHCSMLADSLRIAADEVAER
jgi:hypothetical protein